MCQLETGTEYGPYRVRGKTKWIQTGEALRTVPVTVSTTITKRVWEKWTEGRIWNFFLNFAVLSQWQHMHSPALSSLPVLHPCLESVSLGSPSWRMVPAVPPNDFLAGLASPGAVGLARQGRPFHDCSSPAGPFPEFLTFRF